MRTCSLPHGRAGIAAQRSSPHRSRPMQFGLRIMQCAFVARANWRTENEAHDAHVKHGRQVAREPAAYDIKHLALLLAKLAPSFSDSYGVQLPQALSGLAETLVPLPALPGKYIFCGSAHRCTVTKSHKGT